MHLLTLLAVDEWLVIMVDINGGRTRHDVHVYSEWGAISPGSLIMPGRSRMSPLMFSPRYLWSHGLSVQFSLHGLVVIGFK